MAHDVNRLKERILQLDHAISSLANLAGTLDRIINQHLIIERAIQLSVVT